jgi:tetratricopeptide (TPR) repeat protein
MDGESRESSGPRAPGDRLDSWKAIAAHLNRHVTTVRRWEKLEGLPVHRHLHGRLGSVYAFRSEIDAWWRGRRVQLTLHGDRRRGPIEALLPAGWGLSMVRARRGAVAAGALVSLVLVMVVLVARSDRRPASDASLDPAAQQEYLIGRYHLWRDTDQDIQRAIVHFERATALEPGYAVAHASLAHAWWKRGLWSRNLAATEAPARAALQAALDLDSSLPEAYVVHADLVRLYERDLDRAEQLVNRALELQPDNADAHYTYGLLLMTLGRSSEAIEHMERAVQLDPLSPAIHSDFGRVLYRARRYQEALEHLNRALELEPAMDWLVLDRLADVYEQLGQYDRALAALQQAGSPDVMGRARILARMGEADEARRLIAATEKDMGPGQPMQMAALYAALGDSDAAFQILFSADNRRTPGPNFVAVDPLFDGLRSDSRWPELIRRLSLPTAQAH